MGNIVIHSGNNKGKGANDTTGNAAKEKRIIANKEKISDEVTHIIPKIFFFLIPVMALVLLLLFYNRRQLTYVNHIIFALHYHAFWFSLMWLSIIYNFDTGRLVVQSVAAVISVMYFVVMLKNVYGTGWGRSVLYSVIVGITYLICTLISLGAISYIAFSRYN